MAEFKKDSELTLLKAPFKRCISSARYKAERVKSQNPELGSPVCFCLFNSVQLYF